MKIVIAGAGDVGSHLAELLSFEHQDIVLIDTNQEILDIAASHLDVLTIRGDASSIDILRQAEANKANLFLALTTSEQTNLIAAVLAKKIGAKKVIARVQNPRYLCTEQRALFQELGIDTLICPPQLAAQEISRLVKQCSFTDHFEFEEGKINLVGITLDDYSPLANRKLSEVHAMQSDFMLRPIAILRGHQTLIPRSGTVFHRNDHIYFITREENIDAVINLVGKKKVKVKNVMILGGSSLARDTAKVLEQEYNVTLIERNKEKCKLLAEQLDSTLIINGDTSNFDMLEEEGLSRMDAFVALSGNSETNIIASLTAKNHGVYKTIAQVENKEYIHISQNIGVDTLINKKLITANNIFRFVRKGQVEAITSLAGVDAEIIEYVIHKKNQLTKKPLRELHFPSTAIVGGIIRGEETLIPNGDFQLQVNDKVIIFALPEAITKLEKLFR